MAGADPYALLGVPRNASDAELRRAYRALVKRHHPDHNGGSAESNARFGQIQTAYTAILRSRAVAGSSSSAASGRGPAAKSAPGTPGAPGAPAKSSPVAPRPDDASVEQRIQKMEQDIAKVRGDKARQNKEAALQAAARQKAAYEAVAAAAGRRRPTPEELGYYSTQDSFSMIVDDATEQLGERLRNSEVKRQFTRRLTDLFGDGERPE